MILKLGCCRRRCRRYYVKGEKKGSVEEFIENMPAMPDNIKYDGEGQYWIALSTVCSLPSSPYLLFLRQVRGDKFVNVKSGPLCFLS